MRRALGRGLSQLIAEQLDGGASNLPIDAIVPNPRQPRKVFEEESLQELATSIRQFGLLQPILVQPVAEGKYELIAGERRLRASKIAGLKEIPALFRSATDQVSLEIALIENVQRSDISSLESARAYRRLMDEFGLTQEAVAEKVGKSRVSVANSVRLLKLPKRIQEGLESGAITEGHARALLGFEEIERQLAVYDQIIELNLTVRDVEKLAQVPREKKNPGKRSKELDAHMNRLQIGLSRHFATPTTIQPGKKGGKLILDYYSDDDLQRILDILGFSL